MAVAGPICCSTLTLKCSTYGSFEILAHRERAARRLRRRAEHRDAVLNREAPLRDREDRRLAARVVADAERAAVGEAGVRGEEIHREHVVEEAVGARGSPSCGCSHGT